MQILRLAFGGSLGRLTAAAPVCRRWRLLAHGTAEEASLVRPAPVVSWAQRKPGVATNTVVIAASQHPQQGAAAA
jgi:hypothetical protein